MSTAPGLCLQTHDSCCMLSFTPFTHYLQCSLTTSCIAASITSQNFCRLLHLGATRSLASTKPTYDQQNSDCSTKCISHIYNSCGCTPLIRDTRRGEIWAMEGVGGSKRQTGWVIGQDRCEWGVCLASHGLCEAILHRLPMFR